MFETIIFKQDHPVAQIIMNRPDKLNSFNRQMHKELLQAIKLTKKDDGIRCLIITGSGRAFNAGQDLSDVKENTDYGDLLRETYNPLIKELLSLEKPVVAAVNGVAAGAGFSLALACDFRIASEKASFIEAFINVGLVPDSGNMYFLPRLIGYAKALELAVMGNKVTADEALSLGIVNKVVPSDHFEDEVQTFTQLLAAKPTKTIGLIKKYMQKTFETDVNDMLEFEAYAQKQAGMTSDHLEGVMAFMEKRKPNFTGK